MRTALRRAAIGVGTYIAAYLLMGIATIPLRSRILRATLSEGRHGLWHIYTTTGQPVWKAIGWILLNAHLVVLRIKPEPGLFISDVG